MRLYDLTTPEFRLIASKKFDLPADAPRRLAHKIADEIVLQFTGEPGSADTKLAYVAGSRGTKEILIADYDGSARDRSPATARSTSCPSGVPTRARWPSPPTGRVSRSLPAFPFERRRNRPWPRSAASTRRPRSVPMGAAS